MLEVEPLLKYFTLYYYILKTQHTYYKHPDLTYGNSYFSVLIIITNKQLNSCFVEGKITLSYMVTQYFQTN